MKAAISPGADGSHLVAWSWRELGAGLFGREDVVGIAAVPARARDGIVPPEKALALFPLTREELGIVRAQGVPRVTTMLAHAQHVHPTPWWIDRDRASVATVAQHDREPWIMMPGAFKPGITAFLDIPGDPVFVRKKPGAPGGWRFEGTWRLRVTPEAATALAEHFERMSPRGTTAIAMAPDDLSGSTFVWIPGGGPALARGTSMETRPAAVLLSFIEKRVKMGAELVDDGVVIFLSKEDRDAVIAALRNGADVEIEPPTEGMMPWRLEWNRAGSAYCPSAGACLKRCDGGDQKACDQLRDAAKNACAQDVVTGCAALGALYDTGGLSTMVSKEASVRYLRRACELGDGPSCNNWGFGLAYGQGVQRDDTAAIAAWKRGCELDNARSCGTYGGRLVNGRGIPRDDEHGGEILAKACRLGDSAGCFSFGHWNERHGRRMEALVAWTTACAAKRDDACRQLSSLGAQLPLGAPTDAEAHATHIKDCEANEPVACSMVADDYRNGHGVTRDEEQGLVRGTCVRWFVRALVQMARSFLRRARRDGARRPLPQQSVRPRRLHGLRRSGLRASHARHWRRRANTSPDVRARVHRE
jgi:TPR repeat protein